MVYSYKLEQDIEDKRARFHSESVRNADLIGENLDLIRENADLRAELCTALIDISIRDHRES